MTKILVAAAAYNFAETYRMKTIGKVFKQLGYDVYSMGVGRYSYMLNEGMKYLTTDSDSMWYTGERINRMMNMDLYGNDYCSYEELKKIVYDEIEILREIKPDIVITGYRTTLSLSCRALKIPLVWILSATVSRVYFEKGFATIPERYEENFFQNIKDVNIKNKYYCRLTLKNSSTSKVWNNIARELGVSSFKSDIDIFSGDLNLLSDCPELFPEFRDLENKYQFCGPIFCKNESNCSEPPWDS